HARSQAGQGRGGRPPPSRNRMARRRAGYALRSEPLVVVARLAWKLAAVLTGQASEDILETYEIERAPVVTKMVELSRRLGSVIMPTSRILAAARDTIFAGLNLSGRFRAFIGRGGIMPPPAIHRSALTASGRDAVIGLMAPQPRVKSSHGEAQLDSFLGCHQWLALGFEADPASMLSSRDLAILEALRRAVRLPERPRPGQEPADLGLALRRFAIHRVGREARRSRRSRPPRPLHRRAAGQERRSRCPELIRRRLGRSSPARRLTTAFQGGPHVAFADRQSRTGQRRAAAQPLAHRQS